jgi:hypothetical protein
MLTSPTQDLYDVGFLFCDFYFIQVSPWDNICFPGASFGFDGVTGLYAIPGSVSVPTIT